jgi:hypothetical protein
MFSRAFLVVPLLVSAGFAACSSAGGTEASPGPATTGAGGSTGTGGSDGAGGTTPSGSMLRIQPADAILTPAEGQPASQVYQVFYTPPNGAEIDVTKEAEISVLPPSLGFFFEGTFTAPADSLGQGSVHATARSVSTSTTITVVRRNVVIGPGAPPDAESKFGGATDGEAPQVVYPDSGIVVPPNMNSLEIHFKPAAGQTLFEIAFQSETEQLAVYTGCTPLSGGCVYTPDAAFWGTLADHAAGKQPVTFRIRGVDGGGKIGTSEDRTIAFATEKIVGGLYYWNEAGTIQRYDFGYPGQTAELYLNAPAAGAAVCVGCHVLSPDGKKIAVGMDIPAPAPYKVFEVATRKVIFQGPTGANFFSFSPDGKQILTSNGHSISHRDADTGAAIAEDVVPSGAMPDWAPSGKGMVYAKPGTPPPCIPGAFCGAPGVDSASLEVMGFDGTGWGQPTLLVPWEGQNNYYPSFSPDSAWVVFNRSPGNRNSFDNASAGGDGEIWAVPLSSGAAVKLAAATKPGDQWPKWAPNVMSYYGGQIMWLTFSSPRAYGLRLPEGAKTQLWMVGFDPARAASGDPSFPAFWLPFQDMASGNRIAQWVTTIQRKPCSAKTECESSEICQAGTCVPDIK